MQSILMTLALTFGIALCSAALSPDDVPNPFREYEGKEPVPDALRETYTGFVRSAKGGSVAAYVLPHAVPTSQKARPAEKREYGDDINEKHQRP